MSGFVPPLCFEDRAAAIETELKRRGEQKQEEGKLKRDRAEVTQLVRVELEKLTSAQQRWEDIREMVATLSRDGGHGAAAPTRSPGAGLEDEAPTEW